MKKSTAYKMAQMALLTNSAMNGIEKLGVLRVLIEAEDLALFCEKQEEKEKENAETL